MHAIDEALRLTEFRNQIELHQHWAVHIVHFSGPGY